MTTTAERIADLKETLEKRGHPVRSIETSKGKTIVQFGDNEVPEKDGLNKKWRSK